MQRQPGPVFRYKYAAKLSLSVLALLGTVFPLVPLLPVEPRLALLRFFPQASALFPQASALFPQASVLFPQASVLFSPWHPLIPAALGATPVSSILAKYRSELETLLGSDNSKTDLLLIGVGNSEIKAIISSASFSLAHTGSASVPELIHFIESADLNKPEERYLAIACSNALARNPDAGVAAAIAAIKNNPERKDYYLNALLTEFTIALKHATALFMTSGGQDKAFAAGVIADLLNHCTVHPAADDHRLPEDEHNTRGTSKSAQTVYLEPRRIFKSFSPDNGAISMNEIRLPAQLQAYFARNNQKLPAPFRAASPSGRESLTR